MANDDDVNHDAQLLYRWSVGDNNAGRVLYDRHYRVVQRFFRSKVPEASEDLSQKTWMAVHRSGHNMRKKGSFRAFLLGIARNQLLHHFRSNGRDRLVFNGEEHCCEDLRTGPFGRVAKCERYKHLVKALRRIPLDHQILIELYYWERMNSREISEVLGIPPSTIRQRKKRAMKELRDALQTLLNDDQRVETTMMGLNTWAEEIKRTIEDLGDEDGATDAEQEDGGGNDDR